MRKLIFTTDQLREALINHALRTQGRLPATSIKHVAVVKTVGVTVTFVYAQLDGNNSGSIGFDESNVATALILCCRTRDIPLPRRRRKILTPSDDSVVMLVQIDHHEPSTGTNPAPAPELREKRTKIPRRWSKQRLPHLSNNEPSQHLSLFLFD